MVPSSFNLDPPFPIKIAFWLSLLICQVKNKKQLVRANSNVGRIFHRSVGVMKRTVVRFPCDFRLLDSSQCKSYTTFFVMFKLLYNECTLDEYTVLTHVPQCRPLSGTAGVFYL